MLKLKLLSAIFFSTLLSCAYVQSSENSYEAVKNYYELNSGEGLSSLALVPQVGECIGVYKRKSRRRGSRAWFWSAFEGSSKVKQRLEDLDDEKWIKELFLDKTKEFDFLIMAQKRNGFSPLRTAVIFKKYYFLCASENFQNALNSLNQ